MNTMTLARILITVLLLAVAPGIGADPPASQSTPSGPPASQVQGDGHRPQPQARPDADQLLPQTGPDADQLLPLTRPDAEQPQPARLRRADSFLGIHFDFHAGMDCTQMGATLSEEMVQQVIDKVHPDFIQCDCKGHAGVSSYPTKVGTPVPGFVRDPLRIWRDVTARNGVALYVHYSGLIDYAACKQHPEWAAVAADGKVSEQNMSAFGPYVDQLLIPQLAELRQQYGVDGAWVDGECWAAAPDYSPLAVQAWRAAGHSEEPPRDPADPLWPAWLAFHREGFKSYVRRYTDRLHGIDPQFQLTSNWAFSSYMPEPVSIGLDFLSGDYAPRNAVNTGRIEGRSLAAQGKPWDLMAWGFAHPGDGTFSTKGAVQLMQEAAVVISLGGGFQTYFPQRRDASVNLWQMDVMGQVARFCRARQAFCHQARPVPQVAVLNSSAGYYRASRTVYQPPDSAPLRGTLLYLLEGHNAVEVLSEHHLQGRMDQYPLIVVAQWDYLGDEMVSQLLDYVRRGGSLMLVGAGPAAMFQEHLDVRLEGPAQGTIRSLEWDGYRTPIKAAWVTAVPGASAEVLAFSTGDDAGNGLRIPAATVTRVGNGLIGAIYFDAGSSYHNERRFVVAHLINSLARRLFPEPIVELTGSPTVDVTVMTKQGQLMVNLVNTAGPHGDPGVFTFDHVPPVGPLEVSIRRDHRPQDVMLQPGARKVDYRYTDGRIHLTIDRLELHDVIVVD